MRRTFLMDLAEKHGDAGFLNPRTIDPLVYLLADLAEGRFGRKLLEPIEQDIALSNAGSPRGQGLTLLVDSMIRIHLAKAFEDSGKGEAGTKLKGLKPLDQSTYIDYFLGMMEWERESFRTPVSGLLPFVTQMLTGYQSEQPGVVCNAIVDFFEKTQDSRGLQTLISALARQAKSVPAAPLHRTQRR